MRPVTPQPAAGAEPRRARGPAAHTYFGAILLAGGFATNLYLFLHLHAEGGQALRPRQGSRHSGKQRPKQAKAGVQTHGGRAGQGSHTSYPSDDGVDREELELERAVRRSEDRRRRTVTHNVKAASVPPSVMAMAGAKHGEPGGNTASISPAGSSHSYSIIGTTAMNRAGRKTISPPTEPPLRYDVTLVSQTSDDRLWMISHLARRWGGPLSVAIFVMNGTLIRGSRLWLNRIASQPGSYITEVHGRSPEGYPVNYLRNVAIERVSTSHFFLTDIDLWPSTASYNEVLSQGRSLLRDPHAALVLPAFEYSDPSRGRQDEEAAKEALAMELPDTFDDLRMCVGGHDSLCRIFKASTDTHRSTDYERWWESRAPLRIPCFNSLRYEPYVVVPRLASTPMFDERFFGYGKNKIEWIQHLRFSGFIFYVLARAFVVHCPHAPSTSRQLWQQYRAKKDRLFREFIELEMQNASIRTAMCVEVDQADDGLSIRDGDKTSLTEFTGTSASLAVNGSGVEPDEQT